MVLIKRPISLSIIIAVAVIAVLFIRCEREKAPVTPKNNAPRIEEIKIIPQNAPVNSIVVISGRFSDPDGDKLSIEWYARRGRFINGNIGADVKWNAPSTSGRDTINVKVSDGKTVTEGMAVITVGTYPSVPVLIFPKNESEEISISTELTWNRVPNADNYSLQLSLSKDFSKPLINVTRIKNHLYHCKDLKLNTKYYWRVRSKNIFGYSKWSDISEFTTVAPPGIPEVIFPKNGTAEVGLESSFLWKPISNTKNYTIQIANDKAFDSIIFDESGISSTEIATTRLEYFRNYFWRIKAVNDYGESDWSLPMAFSTVGKIPEIPTQVLPEDKSYNIKLNTLLNWNPVEHADVYSVQVFSDSLLTNLVLEGSNLTQTYYQTSGLKNFTKYFWRINSANKYGNSGWSVTRNFTTLLAQPEVTTLSGDGAELSIRPLLKWRPVEGASNYNLEISTDPSFSTLTFNQKDLADTTFQVTGLEYFKKYYWRISAENNSSSSGWSDSYTFKTTGFFYQGLSYGHQSVYNPFFVILNGGFDMIQVGNQRDVKKFPYKEGIKNIWKNLSAPFGPIGRYGWWNFIGDQVLPISLNKESAQFWPNYNLHLIGGGMEFASLREWYEYHNYPIPGWLAAFTTMGYHFLNEVVENGNREGDDVDPIADFYLFDLGGVILFTSESVRRFFAEDLNLVDWSQQPSFSLRNGELHNNGQFFAVRWKFPFLKSWYAFYYFGTNGVGGLSYKFDNGEAISLGVGAAASDLILLNEATNKKTIGMVGNAAIFYDKNNSLLASLSVTIKTDYMVNLNIYPGVLKFGDISPGLWGAYSQDGNYIFGFTFSWLPFGFGYSTRVSASRY